MPAKTDEWDVEVKRSNKDIIERIEKAKREYSNLTHIKLPSNDDSKEGLLKALQAQLVESSQLKVKLNHFQHLLDKKQVAIEKRDDRISYLRNLITYYELPWYKRLLVKRPRQ